MPAVLLNPDASALGVEQAVLRGAGYQYEVRDFPGPLSIKSVARGRARWKAEDGDFWVGEDALLVLNDRQPYTITVDSRQKVETCCVFFQQGFVESVHRALVTAPEALLDQPFRPAPPVHFAIRLQLGDSPLLRRLKAISQVSGSAMATQPWLENELLLAARDVASLHEATLGQIARVPAARAATREELFKRLCRAREFMHASQDQPVHLDDISRAACLSPYHLHRAFRQAFQETPHEFLSRIRVEAARRMLLDTELPVTEICFRSGFESLGSFSTLFRKRFGKSPRQFRSAGLATSRGA